MGQRTEDNSMIEADNLFMRAYEAEEQGRYSEAFQHLLAASRLGHLESQVALGNYYAEGKGVSKDTSAAREWYERAYKNGSREAAYNLGIDLRNSGDFRGASEWLEKAVDLSDGDACVALAELRLSTEQRKALLERAIRFPPGEITEEARETAEKMLTELN